MLCKKNYILCKKKAHKNISFYEDIYDFNTGNTDLDKIISMCSSYPVSERMKVTEIATQIGVPLDIGKIVTLPDIHSDLNCIVDPSIFQEISKWLIDITNYLNYSTKTTFLTLHLLHHVLPVILPNYSTNPTEKGKIQLLGCLCMFIVTCVSVNDNEHPRSFVDLNYLSADTYDLDQFHIMLVDILDVCGSLITTPTYWNYARYLEDLPDLLIDMCKCEYDSSLMRTLPSRTYGTTKYQSVRYIYKDVERKFKTTYQTVAQHPVDHYTIVAVETPPVYTTMAQFTKKQLASIKYMVLIDLQSEVLFFKDYLQNLQ
jgi:hypothetical protein